MVFSSHLFLFYFLPTALLVYYIAPRRLKHLVLTLLSYTFYGWANPLFVVLMFTSTVIDYVCGLFISRQIGPRRRKGPVRPLRSDEPRTKAQTIALVVSICSNLSLLGFFKYAGLVTRTVNALAISLGAAADPLLPVLQITLPLGISFYTFQSMSYSIDVYRGHAAAIRNFIDFACYVSMFPQLVAGPIIRFQEVADQLRHRTHTLEKFSRGASFVCLGLAKKIFLADSCGKIADMAFNASAVGLADSWFGAVAYSFQIYFDFSGYSDMAIGLGLMLGFVFPKNFDSPYHAQSITEFWRRWHISLSTWLRDYLYIPLGGNRKGEARTYVNLALVMLLGGLWHGAAWTFVIWGGIHGAMLAFERAQGKTSPYRRLPRALRVAITFVIVTFAWVFFRAESFPAALEYCGSMVGLNGLGVTDPTGSAGLIAGLIYQPFYLAMFAVAGLVTWTMPQTWHFTRRLNWWKIALIAVLLFAAITMMTAMSFSPFIYFIF